MDSNMRCAAKRELTRVTPLAAVVVWALSLRSHEWTAPEHLKWMVDANT